MLLYSNQHLEAQEEAVRRHLLRVKEADTLSTSPSENSLALFVPEMDLTSCLRQNSEHLVPATETTDSGVAIVRYALNDNNAPRR
jgi:hypothetical protein